MVLVAVAGFVLDRVTKALAISHLSSGAPTGSLLGGLVGLQLLFNSGAAFSMGTSVTIVFSLLAIIALVFVLVWVWPRARGWVPSVCAGMLAAGIAGNLADRLLRPPGVLRGHVVDFIAVRHFAVFNVADAFITCAAVLFIAYMLFSDPRPADEDARGDS
ncbi:signal peptidase II [Propionibacterium sp.]|uniref:signal peptidase II n=1 Tax=Propionibacterium sp. TaxID=1977903 RepID=UPI0039E91A0E